MDACHEFCVVERLGDIIVSTSAKTDDLCAGLSFAGQDQNRSRNWSRDPQSAQLAKHFMAANIGVCEIEQHNTKVIGASLFKGGLAGGNGLVIHPGFVDHQLNTTGRQMIICYKLYTHRHSLR